MIWALLFGLLFSSIGGTSRLLPNSNQLIKRHVVEQERKELLLEMVKNSQKERKSLLKETKKLQKAIQSLYSTRDSQTEDFDQLISNYTLIRKSSREANLKLALESQELITEEEWQNMLVDFKKGTSKLDKTLQREEASVNKHFKKIEKSLNRHVSNKKNAEVIIEQIEDIRSWSISILNEYRQELQNENSILYQYQVERSKIEELQSDHDNNIKKLLNSYKDLYFLAIENTNEDEWRKIRKKFKLPL